MTAPAQAGARTRIKFCGMGSAADVELAVALGVDAVGFIFAPSPRRTDAQAAAVAARAVPPFVTVFAVVADPAPEDFAEIRRALPAAVPQFCGDEPPEFCRRLAGGGPYAKVVHVGEEAGALDAARAQAERYPDGLIFFDTFRLGRRGGTGAAFDWSQPPDMHFPYVVAGGLTADNVAAAITALRPFAVDVRSGIESGGKKDESRMRAFVEAVRRADGERSHAT